MSEMTERVAKAIYETWAKNRAVTEPWDEVLALGHSIVEEARDEARAAIQAMREPTVEMLAAAYRAVGVPEKPILRYAFNAMIDEAVGVVGNAGAPND